jgi:CubicO group peptidase (beta-lactamase class C family)
VSGAAIDASIVRRLRALADRRTRRVAAAVIDLASAPVVRTGLLDADPESRFEIGSVTKGLTGMLLAHAVSRGEASLDSTVGDLAAPLAGSPLAAVTLRELATHTSGLPRLAGTAPNALRLAAFGVLGLDPYRGISARRLLEVAGRQRLRQRGRVAYSNLGAAVLGQVLATRHGGDFASLLAARVLTPCAMAGAAVAVRHRAAPPGRSAAGLPRAPRIMDGYAPAGGLVATIWDMARLAVGLLRGTAPGWEAVNPLDGAVDPAVPGRRRGMFWIVETPPAAAERMIWHNGATGGYSAFFALWPDAHRGVVVLADTSRPGPAAADRSGARHAALSRRPPPSRGLLPGSRDGGPSGSRQTAMRPGAVRRRCVRRRRAGPHRARSSHDPWPGR